MNSASILPSAVVNHFGKITASTLLVFPDIQSNKVFISSIDGTTSPTQTNGAAFSTAAFSL